MLADQRRERQAGERADAGIHGNAQRSAGVGKLLPIAQRCQHDVMGERQQALIAGPGQKRSRREHPVIWVAAPDQAFGPYERPAAQIDLRLIPKLEPALVERFLEADLYLPASR